MPGKVVNLHQRSGYKPDLAALARNQVANGREKLGLTYAEFADVLAPLLGWKPSPDVIRGWETLATPPGDVVLAVGLAAQTIPHDVISVALNADAERVIELLSSVVNDLTRITGSPVVIRVHAMRGLIARPEWNNIIQNAQQDLWLYGMAEMGYALDDQVPEILASAANSHCNIRVLLLDPDFPGTEDIDLDEGNPPGTLGPRIRAALRRFQQIQDACEQQISIRTYAATPTVSIVRGDEHMLVTPYMRFFAGSNSPTFELKKNPEGNVFDRYSRHFESMWNLAKEWTG